MEQSYNKLFNNNNEWISRKRAEDPDYFTNLAKGQQPQYLYIGCSDSRLPVNEMTGTSAGEIFIHRNIANMVLHTDLNAMAVLQYSVEALKVKHVIVCGHYGCGGIKAAMDNNQLGLIDSWLRNINDVYRLYRHELDAIDNEEARLRRLVELNVKEQVGHIAATAIMQNAWQRGQEVRLHGWVYDLSQGRIVDLHVDMEKDFPDMDIYRYKQGK